MDNKELLKKADLALADLSGDGVGGLLNPEQADTFIRKLIVQPNMLNENTVRFVPMNSPQKNINKIGFGKRILRKAVQGTALATAAIAADTAFDASAEATARAKPLFEQIQMNTKEVIAEIRIPYDVMEDNIERATVASNEAMNTGPAGLRATILTMIAEAASRDLEELCLLGDTTLDSADPYLDLLDGWLKNATDNGNLVDLAGATVSKKMFKDGLKAMPVQYKNDASLLQNFVSKNNELEYRDTLADRGTIMGDGYVTGGRPALAYEMMVKGVAQMPAAKGLLTNPKNLLFGIQRQVSLEFDKAIQTREYIIVLTARVDAQIEEDDAIVAYANIGSE